MYHSKSADGSLLNTRHIFIIGMNLIIIMISKCHRKFTVYYVYYLPGSEYSVMLLLYVSAGNLYISSNLGGDTLKS